MLLMSLLYDHLGPITLTCSSNFKASSLHGQWTRTVSVCLCVCICVYMCVDQRFHGWQRSGTVSHSQPFRNVPWPWDGLCGLISRAPSPWGLSACVRHSLLQTHAGGVAASCGSFPALTVSLSHCLSGWTSGWQSVLPAGLITGLPSFSLNTLPIFVALLTVRLRLLV